MRDRRIDDIIAQIVRSFEAKRWRHRAPLKGMEYWHDRNLARLFEGTTRLDARQALIRSLQANSMWFDPHGSGETLKWGHRQGLVGYSVADGKSEWRLLRQDVTFVPHDRSSIDVRKAGERIGSHSTRTVIEMERKRRLRFDAEDLRSTNDESVSIMRAMHPHTLLPADLIAPDLPPVTTVGALLDNFDSFARQLPLHRARHIQLLLDVLYLDRDRDRVALSELPPAATELDDFKL